ncbi:hypothetical protein [Syntrophobacter fumaroxidans]|uniref:hypothetical protein n=1 Tax=Syntrophobacter fumaroxidans TaxID=119484 RepID=UPI00059D228C|nr:hypothetical protein [Syntrophobacter fumaroxidans]
MILVFVAVEAVEFIDFLYKYKISHHYNKMLFVKISVLGVYLLLSYLAYEGIQMAIVAFRLLLIINGVWILIFCLLGVNYSQYILKIIGIIIGAYFLLGGILLLRNTDSSLS